MGAERLRGRGSDREREFRRKTPSTRVLFSLGATKGKRDSYCLISVLHLVCVEVGKHGEIYCIRLELRKRGHGAGVRARKGAPAIPNLAILRRKACGRFKFQIRSRTRPRHRKPSNIRQARTQDVLLAARPPTCEFGYCMHIPWMTMSACQFIVRRQGCTTPSHAPAPITGRGNCHIDRNPCVFTENRPPILSPRPLPCHTLKPCRRWAGPKCRTATIFRWFIGHLK